MGESTNKDKNKMKCIKCIYIFRQLIDNLKEVRLLKLIKYNKKLQKKLNLNINNYMEFQKIKIELNTFNAGIKIFFIGMPIFKHSFFHIYFDDDKNEIKKNYFTTNENVTKITILIDRGIDSLRKLFSDCKCIEK